MKILVTGAYGQLGNELKDQINQFPDLEFLLTDVDSLDITSQTEVGNYFLKYQPDFVINCAAYTAVDKAETEIELALKINAIAPGILAKAAREISARIIHISTDYVFNGDAFLPLTESDQVNPTGIYGKTKLKGEENCIYENADSLIIRTSWLYSAYGNNFLKTILRLGNEKNEIKVVFDQVGTPTYATDLASAILHIIRISENDSKNFIPGIYHYSNEGVASWYDFAIAILEISNTTCFVKPVLSEEFPTPAKRPAYSVLNKSKIKNTFKLEIPYWKDSLKICIEKLKNK